MASYSSPLHLNVNDMVDLPTKAEISISFRDVGCYFFCDHTLHGTRVIDQIKTRKIANAIDTNKKQTKNK